MTGASEKRAGSAEREWRLITLPQRGDSRGMLGFAQEGREIPFHVKRLFYLYAVPPGASRGSHAHREQHQLVMMLSGSCEILLDDGTARHTLVLGSRSEALYVPPLVWLELSGFSGAGSVCAVLTSGLFDERDYIRDYAEFQSIVCGGV